MDPWTITLHMESRSIKMIHKAFYRKSFLHMSALCVSLLCAGVACEKEPVIAKQGETCHISSDGWRSCDKDLLCLSPFDQERLKERAAPDGNGIITQTSGHIDDHPELYESDGLLSGRKLLKGTCFAKVALGEPCASNEMCKEGICMQSAGEAEGTIVEKCSSPAQ